MYIYIYINNLATMADSQKSTYMYVYIYMYTHVYIKNLSPMANSQKSCTIVVFYSTLSSGPTFEISHGTTSHLELFDDKVMRS